MFLCTLQSILFEGGIINDGFIFINTLQGEHSLLTDLQAVYNSCLWENVLLELLPENSDWTWKKILIDINQ